MLATKNFNGNDGVIVKTGTHFKAILTTYKKKSYWKVERSIGISLSMLNYEIKFFQKKKICFALKHTSFVFKNDI